MPATPVSAASDGVGSETETFGVAKRSAGRCTTGINTSTCITLATSRTSKVNAMAGRGQAVFSRAMPSACTRAALPRWACSRPRGDIRLTGRVRSEKERKKEKKENKDTRTRRHQKTRCLRGRNPKVRPQRPHPLAPRPPQPCSFPGGAALCTDPGPLGTGLICAIDAISGAPSSGACCTPGGQHCTLPPGSCCEGGSSWPHMPAAGCEACALPAAPDSRI